MAQLTDDCFAFGGAMLGVEEAIRQLRSTYRPVEQVERVPLRSALGRVLADDVVAPISVPAFENSAVDGYAVRHADLAPAGETRLPVAGRLAAGGTPIKTLPESACIRIFTGAPMPSGADTVFMQEDVRLEGAVAVLPQGLRLGANRRHAGEDFTADACIVPMGTRLDARHLAAIAALGLDEVPVRRGLRVALFSTGEEIVSPGMPLRPGAQYDSNRFLLAGLLQRRALAVSDLGILPDQRDAVAKALSDAARDHDVIITSGGVSGGEEDHVRHAVDACGVLSFWRLAIKPGRPVAVGRVANAVFIGLPGNPVASFVTFVMVAAPLIDHLAGISAASPLAFPVRCDFKYGKKAGRREYVRAKLALDEAGQLVARKFPREGAALLSSLLETDGLIELAEDQIDIERGTQARFLPYAALM